MDETQPSDSTTSGTRTAGVSPEVARAALAEHEAKLARAAEREAALMNAAAKIRARTSAKLADSRRLVTLPECGVAVEVRCITEGQRIAMLRDADRVKAAAGGGDADPFLHQLIAATCHDPVTGALIFAGDDAALLHEMLIPDVRALTEAALEVSVLTDAAQKAVGND